MPEQTITEHPLTGKIRAALHGVNDPEIRRPITDLGMVESIDVDSTGRARVEVLLTISGCPMRDTLQRDVTAAVRAVPGVREVEVALGVMSDEQRAALRDLLKGGQPEREIPFARPNSLTTVIAVASGKGGVGKSSVTVNLALALAAQGRSVGVLDADIYGHSVPAMLGVADQRPTAVEDMIMPVPAHGLRVISIGMLKPRRDQVVAWRGPILDRALTQMLADVYWGDLDSLRCDLPPGPGDIAISLAQMLPNADMLVVTTPQQAAQRVALRAGQTTAQTGMKVAGVIENMATFVAPDTGKEYRIFGEGGGQLLAAELNTRLLGSIPIDPRLREQSDAGVPLVLADPESPTSLRIGEIAAQIAASRKKRSLVGKPLPLHF